jgi:F-type H+-transporting ATPase subunit a
MEGLIYKTVFTIPCVGIPFLAGLFPNGIAINETIVLSWVIMGVVIALALVFTRGMKLAPTSVRQNLAELGVTALNSFAEKQFGKHAKFLGNYFGTILLFLLVANISEFCTPVDFHFAGRHYIAPFIIKPPTRDINVTVLLGAITILMMLFYGIRAKGPIGWVKHLFYPVGFMLPFNIMEYGTRFLSLSLRLFGNILGGLVLMLLIENLAPFLIPIPFSLYFDFFDGTLQAGIFVFLSVLYISEACENTPSA